MADRVSESIVLGGTIDNAAFTEITKLIQATGSARSKRSAPISMRETSS